MNQPSTPTGKHSKALFILFLTEMWERFAYYLMVGILWLYLTDHDGRAMPDESASDITGNFIALIWLPLFLGGYIADRYLGYVRSIFIGGALLAAGYLGMALPGNTTLFVSLGLIIVGNGFFKPNISTLLGNIYNREDLKPLKDNAYNIFYMGINIGATVSPFIAAFLRNKYGWGAAFAAAGIGMILSIITLASFLRHVKAGDIRKAPQQGDMPLSQILLYVFLPGLAAALIGYFLPSRIFGTTIMGSPSSDAFVFACIPVISFFISIWLKAKGEDKKGIGALLFIFSISVIFWSIYNMNSTAYTLWAEKHTDRTLSPFTEKIADRLGELQSVNASPRPVDSLNENMAPVKDDSGHIIKTTGPHPYFHNLPKDRWPAPGKDLKLANTELFQSINPFFIVLLSPLAVLLFGYLRQRGKEPTTPAKFGFALFLSGLSSLVMVFAVLSISSVYQYKASPWWLWGTYFIFTIGEIFCSPMGLSLVSKLAPPRITSLMMGGWFLTMSLGGKLAGVMTSSWNKFPDKKVFFLIWFIAATIGGTLIFGRIKSLNRIVRQKTGEA